MLDADVLSLLEAVQAGRLQPDAAAMQLRERSAGYQQVTHAHTIYTLTGAARQHLQCHICMRSSHKLIMHGVLLQRCGGGYWLEAL